MVSLIGFCLVNRWYRKGEPFSAIWVQSFRFIINKSHSSGSITGDGKPGCRAPILCITTFTALRSCNSLRFPLFLGMVNIDVFHGLVEGTTCPALNWSSTNPCIFSSLSEFSSYWSIQTGSSVFQLIFRIGYPSVTAPKKDASLTLPSFGSINHGLRGQTIQLG